MTTKRPLSLGEHRDIGVMLRFCQLEIQASYIDTAQHTLPVSHKTSRRWHRVIDEIDQLRSEMDGICCRQHPAEFSASIYYGGGTA